MEVFEMQKRRLLILSGMTILIAALLVFIVVKLLSGSSDEPPAEVAEANNHANVETDTPAPAVQPTAISLEEGLLITFNPEDKSRFATNFYPRTNSWVTWADGESVSHNDDGYALMGTHTEGRSYTSSDNAIRFSLPLSLEPGGIYRITAWFYIPKEGNEGKTAIMGPGIVLDGDYGNVNAPSKFPDSTAPPITFDEWHKFEVTLPVRPTEVKMIDFRFMTNDEPNHPDVWYIDDVEIVKVGEEPLPAWELDLDSLYKAYEDYFLFGNAIEPQNIRDSEFAEMYKRQYNAVTLGNSMKPDALSGGHSSYRFSNADAFVNWATQNNIRVHGHTLVWHAQSPDWLNKNEDGSPLTREEAKANLEDFMRNVAGHFSGKVISWDVVNEAFADGGRFDGDWTKNLRKDAPWYMAYENGADKSKGESGADYLYDAFVLARQYDPNAVLYYNDYNETVPTKREAIAAMVEDLNKRWESDERNTEPGRLLIEGIGMQSHFNTNHLRASDVEATIQRFIETGAIISVTELDITVGNYHGRETPLTKEEEIMQAKLYAQLFSLYKKYADHIERVTIWGAADSMSWRAQGNPTLFNRSYKPKESYYAVMDPEGYLAEHP